MEKLLSPRQVAEILNVNKEVVMRYLRSKKLKGHKIAGWLWRIKNVDLEAFIEGNDKENKSG